MHLNNRLSVHIESNTNDPDAYVLIHNRQVLNNALHVVLKNGAADIFLEKNQQGDGISHITVFNSKRQPVCERLIFTYPSQHLISMQKQTCSNMLRAIRSIFHWQAKQKINACKNAPVCRCLFSGSILCKRQ
jgi:hypothetical protein